MAPKAPASLLMLLAILLCFPLPGLAGVHIELPRHRIQATELGVVINDRDPLSIAIADYYMKARGIPKENLLHVNFTPGRSRISPGEFDALQREIDRQAGPHIQALAISWAAPYRVDCMSITSALTFGYDRDWCSARRCAPTRHNPWFNRHGSRPRDEFGIRPTVALAALDVEQARQLIDRGLAADGSHPRGTAYLLSTTDPARNVRAALFERTARTMRRRGQATELVHADSLHDRDDILFYFTGVTRVEGLESLEFLPGAIADHLTSGGGRLTDSRQMSSLRWLQAGATGSYGTVVEPCNLTGKFPVPALVMDRYLRGKTLLEAYWQSVQQPGEGIFIGDPLAAPFDGYRVQVTDGQLLVETGVLWPGRYRVLAAEYPAGPYRALPGLLTIGQQQRQFELPRVKASYYRIEAMPADQGLLPLNP